MTQAPHQDGQAAEVAPQRESRDDVAIPTVPDAAPFLPPTDLPPPTDEPITEPAGQIQRRSIKRRAYRAWHSVNGLVTIPDLLAKLGFWLYRGTMKRTVGVGIALMSVMFVGTHEAIDSSLTFKQAVSATSIILLISFVGGLMLMGISGSFARSQLTAGEAKGSNMLEEMKKQRAVAHRDRLWDQVFKYEQDLVDAREQIHELKLIHDNQPGLNQLCHPNTKWALGLQRIRELRAVMRELGRTREGWDLTFDYACQVPCARTVLKDRLRYDLTKLKDWYDGAPFHHTDTKLPEQFAAAENLQAAKREVGLDWWFLFWHTRKRMLQAMWFKMISRAIQLRVSQACQQLDRKYEPYHFAPDQFLWPHSLAIDSHGDVYVAEVSFVEWGRHQQPVVDNPASLRKWRRASG